MNQLSRIWLLQISVLVCVSLLACAAPHDFDESLNVIGITIPGKTKERIPPTLEQRTEGYEIVQRLAKQFSINFFKKIAWWQALATVLSPLSFFIPLSMLSYGAEGAERDVFLSAIGLRRNETRIAKYGYKRLINTLSHYNMKVSTKVYYTADLTPKPSFAAFAKNFFKADLEAVSVDDEYISTEKVNDWIKSQTNNECAELFKAPLKIGPKPSIVLVNTVYFKGAWKSPFDSSLTTQRPFHIFDSDPVDVPTMHKLAKMPYGRIDAMNSSFVELSFQTTEAAHPMSMFIILPDRKQEINWIAGELEKFNFENLRNTTMRNVNLYLPKFKSEYSHLNAGSDFDYILGAANPLKTQVTLTNMVTPSKLMSFGNNAMKFVIEVNEDGDTTTGSSGTYYNKNEAESVNRNVRAITEEADVEFDANYSFLAIIATKGEVLQDVAIINFNGFPFMPASASMWGLSVPVGDSS